MCQQQWPQWRKNPRKWRRSRLLQTHRCSIGSNSSDSFVYHPFQLRWLKSRKKANWRATKSRLQLRWVSSQIMQKFSTCVWDSCRSWFMWAFVEWKWVFCPRLQAAAEGIVKQMEAKTYSCSECGLKTPSRMTYIQVSHSIKYFSTVILICVSLQHVLNGCIMDMVVGGSEEESPCASWDQGLCARTRRIPQFQPCGSSSCASRARAGCWRSPSHIQGI